MDNEQIIRTGLAKAGVEQKEIIWATRCLEDLVELLELGGLRIMVLEKYEEDKFV